MYVFRYTKISVDFISVQRKVFRVAVRINLTLERGVRGKIKLQGHKIWGKHLQVLEEINW